MRKITFLQVYNAVRIFLNMYYQQTKSENIGGMQLCTGFKNWKDNPMTWDSAAWEDWINGVNKTMKDLGIKESPKIFLYSQKNAFLCMKNYLDLFYQEVPFPDVGKLLVLLRNTEFSNNDQTWKNWLQAIDHSANGTYQLD